MSEKRGPYMTEDGDTVWLPVADHTLNEARHAAAEFAVEMDDPWSRTRYRGKETVALCDHDGWDGECPQKDDKPELAWAFTIYEGTWRR